MLGRFVYGKGRSHVRVKRVPENEAEIGVSMNARHDDIEQRIREWRVRILDAIGEKTDPLALEAVSVIEQLPSSLEREAFMTNVMRRLVQETFYASGFYDGSRTQELGETTALILGDTIQGAYIGGPEANPSADLRNAVITESLPIPRQEQLEGISA